MKKNKYIIISLFAFFFLIVKSKVFAYSTSNFNPEYGITTSNVNLRKQALIEPSTILFSIQKDTNIKIVGTINEFYIVILSDGKIGLVSKEFVNINGNEGNFPEYTNVDKYYATANSSVNIRGGAGTNFQIIGKLKQDEKVEVIGKIDNFLLIIAENNSVGMVRDDLVSKVFNISESQIDDKVNELLNLINNEREKNWCKCKMAQVFASNHMEKGGATQYGKTAKVHCTIRNTGAR